MAGLAGPAFSSFLAATTTGTMAVILPSLSSFKSGNGCSLALMKPPLTTALRDSTKMPTPLVTVPMMPLDFFGGGGASTTSSAIVRFQCAVRCRNRIEQVLCQTGSSVLCSEYSVTYPVIDASSGNEVAPII